MSGQHDGPRSAARRAYLSLSRATLRQADDKPLMQELTVDFHFQEWATNVERFQQYGLTTYPHNQTQQQGQSSGAGGQTGQQSKQPAAEGLVTYVNGSRDHPIVIAIDDRRYRVTALAEGEICLYDDQGHQVHISRNGVVVSAPNNKTITAQIMKSSDPPKKNGGSNGSTGGTSSSSGQSSSDFGLVAQITKDWFASFHVDQNTFAVNHPKAIAHAIITDDDQHKVKYSHSIDQNGNQTVNMNSITHNIVDSSGNVLYSHSIDQNGNLTASLNTVNWNKA
jgi:phage gp45-like